MNILDKEDVAGRVRCPTRERGTGNRNIRRPWLHALRLSPETSGDQRGDQAATIGHWLPIGQFTSLTLCPHVGAMRANQL